VFGKYGLKIHPKFISFYFSQIWYETKVSLSKWVKNRVHWVHSEVGYAFKVTSSSDDAAGRLGKKKAGKIRVRRWIGGWHASESHCRDCEDTKAAQSQSYDQACDQSRLENTNNEY
jgi:hypothetical protein